MHQGVQVTQKTQIQKTLHSLEILGDQVVPVVQAVQVNPVK